MGMGDNFYDSGIDSKHKDRFSAGFEDAFSASAFKNMPFYAIAGNHDHWGDVSVQVDYHQKGSGRWNFPQHNYNVDETLPDGKKLRFCMFDSVDLIGMSHMLDNGTKIVPEGPRNLQTAAINWKALETCLDSDAEYLFTVAHYPAFSGSSHGSVMESTKLPSLLSKYRATGHLAGHDHTLQHIDRDGQCLQVQEVLLIRWHDGKRMGCGLGSAHGLCFEDRWRVGLCSGCLLRLRRWFQLGPCCLSTA